MKNIFRDKWFIIFFFGSIAASVISMLLLEEYGKNIYSRGGRLMFGENVPWMMIIILYFPSYILSRILFFLGDAIDFISFVVQGFMYGFIGLHIKNVILARKIQSESGTSVDKSKKFGIIAVYYTITVPIIYFITIFGFYKALGLLILLVIGSSIVAAFIGLTISIIGMFKDSKKTLSIIMFIVYGIIITIMQYLHLLEVFKLD